MGKADDKKKRSESGKKEGRERENATVIDDYNKEMESAGYSAASEAMMQTIIEWLPGALVKIFDNYDVQLELGRRLEQIDSRLTWEVGPCGADDAYLAFSPNFHADLLAVTKQLADGMPPCSGWQFLDAKPKKPWATRKILLKGIEYFFDKWRYRLVMFNNGEFFDVDLFTFDSEIPQDLFEDLGEFLVSSELGEKLFMSAIDRVNINIYPEVNESTIPIESLGEQLTKLFCGNSL